MPGMSKVHFSLHTALTAWQWSPFSVCVPVALVIIGYFYLRADWRLASRGRRWPARRTVAFLAGLVAVDLALQSPVATFTASYFQAHVAQHLLLMVVAPPLLALGAPSTLLLQTAGRATKRKWLAVLRSRPFAIATHPVLVWFFYFGAMLRVLPQPYAQFRHGAHGHHGRRQPGFPAGRHLLLVAHGGAGPDSALEDGLWGQARQPGIGCPFREFPRYSHHVPGGTHRLDVHPVQHPGRRSAAVGSHGTGHIHRHGANRPAVGAGRRPGWAQSRRQGSTGADGAGPRTTTGGLAPADMAPADMAPADMAPADMASADLALAGETRAATLLLGEKVRPLFQPGNSSWEAMWRAKAGFVPSPRPRSAGGQDGEPSGR